MNATGTPTGSPSVSKKLSYLRRPKIETVVLGPSSEQSGAKTFEISDKEKEELVEIIASLESDFEPIWRISSLDPSLQLQLTFEAIKLNPDNDFAWEIRQKIIDENPHFLSSELDAITALPKDLNHYKIWQHRLWIATELGHEYMLKEFRHALDHVKDNPEDSPYGAWNSLNILSDMLGTVVKDEGFNLVRTIFMENNEHHQAWALLCPLSKNYKKKALGCQLKQVMKFLLGKPKHSAAWDYLESLALRLAGDSVVKKVDLIDGIVAEEKGLNNFACLYRKKSKAWFFVGVEKETKFTEDVLLKDASNELVWQYRLELLETEGLLNLEEELTRRILSKKENANNARVWYQRRLFLEACGGWDEELAHSASFLEDDVDNECAWEHRSFVVLGREDLEDVGSVRTSEVERVTEAIIKNPKNRFVWMYLQSLYIPMASDNTQLGSLFAYVCLEGHYQITSIIDNALETLNFVISVGYEPSKELGEYMTRWFSSNKLSADNVNLGKRLNK